MSILLPALASVMTRSCVVVHCNSNNKVKVIVNGVVSRQRPQYVTVFPFPQDQELFKQWLEVLPNKKGSVIVNEYNGVCINHFRDDQILGDKRKKLAQGSIPSIFGDEIIPKSRRIS